VSGEAVKSICARDWEGPARLPADGSGLKDGTISWSELDDRSLDF